MQNWQEYVGYLASILVVISFLVGNDLKKIRWINMIGCMVFVAYGISLYFKDGIGIPIIITNIFITIIQIYYLFIKKN